MTIPICFDVLGTCFSLDAARDALVHQYGDQFKAKTVDPTQLVDDWFHSAQRDFTYLSMNGTYIPIGKCLTATLPRTLLMAGITPHGTPLETPTPTAPFLSPFSSSELAPVLSSLSAMTPRPSLLACSTLLHSTSKFSLFGCTNGGESNTRALYDHGLGVSESAKWGVWSCDMVQMAKPDPRVYDAIWNNVVGDKGNRDKGWFVASHTWDLHAAKKAGFRTAWVAYEELLVIEELYGRPDVVAVDLVDAARQIIELEN